MESENRSILIFFSVFVLLVFLDHQSALQLHRRDVEIIPDEVRSDHLPKKGADFDAVDAESSEAAIRNLNRPAVEKDAIPGERRAVKTPTKPLSLKEISLESLPVHALPNLPSLKKDGQEFTTLALFFPAFQGRRTAMVKVQRKVQGRVDPERALRLLQRGPESKERGLVNAMDSSVSLERVEFNRGIAYVFAGPSIHRMNAAILQDRLDQICLTLFQFPQIRGVQLLVEGRAVKKLGNGREGISLPDVIGRTERPIQDYREF